MQSQPFCPQFPFPGADANLQECRDNSSYNGSQVSLPCITTVLRTHFWHSLLTLFEFSELLYPFHFSSHEHREDLAIFSCVLLSTVGNLGMSAVFDLPDSSLQFL